jgi:hypothetical protein
MSPSHVLHAILNPSCTKESASIAHLDVKYVQIHTLAPHVPKNTILSPKVVVPAPQAALNATLPQITSVPAVLLGIFLKITPVHAA